MSEPISAAQNLAEFFSMNWVNILAALLTPTIAVFGPIIAYLQWRLAKLSFNEKLFEKRYRIVSAVKRLVITAKANEDAEVTEAEHELLTHVGEARYLFSPEIHDKIISILFELRKLKRLEKRSEASGHRMSDSSWNEIANQMSAMDAEINKALSEIDGLTMPYMSLSKL
ncbi:MAG: hypothetical protein AAF665_03575 [Pseudomonadota bacterium]